MAENLQKTVWVLGTGFSAPLGGPMLNQLLSLGLHKEIAIRYSANGLNDPIMMDVIRLFHFGRQFPEGANDLLQVPMSNTKGELLWDHAEDFLDILDTCVSNRKESFRQHLEQILNSYHFNGPPAPTLENISDAARLHIAAECCSFLERNGAATERWRPYLRWAKDVLGPNDEIITFNYDCVLERLGLQQPFADVITDLTTDAVAPQTRPRIYKLHGSTSWVGTKGTGDAWSAIQEKTMTAALACKAEERVIATPGPNKTRAANALQGLWKRAKDALTHADAIVFVGYRFPPSDSDARSELFDAIGLRSNASRLFVHTVLGPSLEHSSRLTQMLRYIKPNERSCDIHVHSLYAQDFMSLVTRARLFERSV